MNDKFLLDTFDTDVDEALLNGTFNHNFKLEVVGDSKNMNFKSTSSGTNDTPTGDMFALVEIAFAVFTTYAKEYDLTFHDSVEHFLMYLSDRTKLEKENKSNGKENK